MRIIVEKIAEELVLLLLAAAENEIKQAFGRTHFGRQCHRGNDGGNKSAAQLALKGQFDTQSLLHPTLEHQKMDEKRALNGAKKGKELGERVRQAPHFGCVS
ncbi:hypothetical protein [Bradyrhizobium manausense]|uniref:hypothetical protein n=1 Tax=Bradyrhizobium manausense TaxID=989370 RepID=UPI00138EE4DB|nr:hypothetical protein [Bradyrhizobium manausense]